MRRWFAEDVAAIMERLPPRGRIPEDVQAESMQDIADSLGVSRSTIVSILYKARIAGFSAYPPRPTIEFGGHLK